MGKSQSSTRVVLECVCQSGSIGRHHWDGSRKSSRMATMAEPRQPNTLDPTHANLLPRLRLAQGVQALANGDVGLVWHSNRDRTVLIPSSCSRSSEIH